MSEIIFKPIGQVKTQSTESDIRAEGKDLPGDLEIFTEFEPALEGIDGYSHIFVLAYFDRLRPDQIGPLQVKPPRLVNRGFKLEDLPLLALLRPRFADAAQSDRAHAGALARTARAISQSQRPRFFRRHADPRHQRLPPDLSRR